jgi:YidC/Oxa1 family membrane protein insertase
MPAASPDNPMGQSQKYMMYIMPFFALSGLYWPFGLVLYWVTTNLWTLGQQWVLFKRWPQPAAAGGTAAATAPAIAPSSTGRAVTAPRKRANASPGEAGPPSDSRDKAEDVRDQGSTNGASRRRGNGGQPRGAGRRPTAAGSPGAKAAPPGGAPSPNGSGMLRRLGKRAEPEPPAPEPEAKLVRQQRQRQSRSKRSGKR